MRASLESLARLFPDPNYRQAAQSLFRLILIQDWPYPQLMQKQFTADNIEIFCVNGVTDRIYSRELNAIEIETPAQTCYLYFSFETSLHTYIEALFILNNVIFPADLYDAVLEDPQVLLSSEQLQEFKLRAHSSKTRLPPCPHCRDQLVHTLEAHLEVLYSDLKEIEMAEQNRQKAKQTFMELVAANRDRDTDLGLPGVIRPPAYMQDQLTEELSRIEAHRIRDDVLTQQSARLVAEAMDTAAVVTERMTEARARVNAMGDPDASEYMEGLAASYAASYEESSVKNLKIQQRKITTALQDEPNFRRPLTPAPPPEPLKRWPWSR